MTMSVSIEIMPSSYCMKMSIIGLLGVVLSLPVHAETGPPLKEWKTVMEMAKQQYNKGNHVFACRHATNLAHFMNKENFELQKRQASQQMINDLARLEKDWQTYVGKYCSYEPPVNRSNLWPTINRL